MKLEMKYEFDLNGVRLESTISRNTRRSSGGQVQQVCGRRLRRGSLIDRRHPISWPGASFQFRPARHGDADIVPASLIFIVRIVSEDVLAVNLMADLGDRVLEPLLLEETEL